jgi:hypothetical protein
MSTPQEPSSSQKQPPIDVIEPDPTVAPRPEEQAADEVRAEEPATPQP